MKRMNLQIFSSLKTVALLVAVVSGLVATGCQPEAPKEQAVSISSPSKNNTAHFKLDGGKLTYTLQSGGKELLATSALGITREDVDFTDGLELVAFGAPKAISETYTLKSGKKLEQSYSANELTIQLKKGTLEELAAYANSKGVKLLIWYNSGGPHNDVTEAPRGIMDNDNKRLDEFKRIAALGIAGVKIDFFQSDKPLMMKLYKDILEYAAKAKILVNFHGCTIPRGWKRTYPNLLGYESTRGAECYTFSDTYPETAPVCNTILPVTRNVVGPMGYTPMLFSETEKPHTTSYGHELALPIIFECGFLHFADNPTNYMAAIPEVKSFLETIPVVWDESIFVGGWPGKETIIARRSGAKWYVAGINGENNAKDLSFALDFLGEGEYKLDFIKDKEAKALQAESITKTSKDQVTVATLERGGFIAVIEKI